MSKTGKRGLPSVTEFIGIANESGHDGLDLKNNFQMDKEEAVQRLAAIKELADIALTDGRPMLNYTWDLLNKIQAITCGWSRSSTPISTPVIQPLKHVIISCDASITKNPGGKVAVGIVIQVKDEAPIEFFRIMRKSETSNEGEYDAIYAGLTQLMSLKNNPGCEIEVRSDSKVAVDQINGNMKCNSPRLQKRRDAIRELVLELPVPVSFQWHPRNSTSALERANFLCQDALGIKRH